MTVNFWADFIDIDLLSCVKKSLSFLCVTMKPSLPLSLDVERKRLFSTGLLKKFNAFKIRIQVGRKWILDLRASSRELRHSFCAHH